MSIRVVIVDDHDVIRVGVRESLDADIEVVGEGRDVESAVAVIAATRPDVVILDVHLPGGKGGGALDVLAQILAGENPPRVLALSVSDAAEDVVAGSRAAVTAGAPPVGFALDAHPPGGKGGAALDVLPQILAGETPPRVLALSVSDAAEDVVAVVRAGARGYVTKSISGPDLSDA